MPSFFLGLGLTMHAQQAAVASGGEGSGSSGSASYSIGQTFYTTQLGSSGSNAMGVQQPIEVSDLGTDIPSISNLGIKVYPNPVTSYVNLQVENLTGKLSFELYDFNGLLISNKELQESLTRIDMEALPTATYFLIVKKQGKQVKNFKLIKKD